MLLNSDKLASDYLNTTETETKLGDRVQKADIKLKRKQAWENVKAEKAKNKYNKEKK